MLGLLRPHRWTRCGRGHWHAVGVDCPRCDAWNRRRYAAYSPPKEPTLEDVIVTCPGHARQEPHHVQAKGMGMHGVCRACERSMPRE